MSHFARISAILLSVAGTSAWAAGEIQGQMSVQITVGTGCTVTNGSQTGGVNNFGSLTFGDYTNLDNTIDGRSVGNAGGASFGLECSVGTNYSIAISGGASPNGSQRRMQNGGQFVSYNLYQDSARSVPWGDGGATGTVLTGSGTGADEEVIVYGRVPAQATPAPGTYNDTVQVTVTW